MSHHPLQLWDPGLGLQVLSLGRETGEGGLELSAGDSEEGIAGSQVKGVDLDVGGRPFVWKWP